VAFVFMCLLRLLAYIVLFRAVVTERNILTALREHFWLNYFLLSGMNVHCTIECI